jgi:hypothetical protein
LRLYHEYRHWLAEGEGLDPGADLTAIAEAILRDRLPTGDARPGLAGDDMLGGPVAASAAERAHAVVGDPGPPPEAVVDPAPPPTVVGDSGRPPAAFGDPGPLVTTRLSPYGRPRLLPRGVPDFVGRDAELDMIASALGRLRGPFGPAIVTVSGLGGVGKTTLAVHAARAAADGYPDGCLHADLRGSTPRSADPTVVLGSFLRARSGWTRTICRSTPTSGSRCTGR